MGNDNVFDMECNTFSSKKIDNIVLFRFNNNFLLRTTDLSVRDRLLDYLDLVGSSDAVQVLVIIGSPEKKGCEEYYNFYRHVLNSELGMDAIYRMFNVMNQVILKLVGLNKFVIHGNSGEIISSFFNLSLACDYRILADNSVFLNPCMDLGLLPKGGGAFFLPKIIGLTKAYDLLLSGRKIVAAEALDLGVVNQVVPTRELEDAALGMAKRFCQIPETSLVGIKHLLNYSLKDLETYLEFENQVLIKTINSSFNRH